MQAGDMLPEAERLTSACGSLADPGTHVDCPGPAVILELCHCKRLGTGDGVDAVHQGGYPADQHRGLGRQPDGDLRVADAIRMASPHAGLSPAGDRPEPVALASPSRFAGAFQCPAQQPVLVFRHTSASVARWRAQMS